jgi:hypothetical protein
MTRSLPPSRVERDRQNDERRRLWFRRLFVCGPRLELLRG